ncbi:MAG: OmpH family outer membrane protein, partial [Chitinophagaceae bacterium]
MTRTTTKASSGTVIVSWVITLALCGAVMLFFNNVPASGSAVIVAEEKSQSPGNKPSPRKSATKATNSLRPLPKDFAKNLVEQTEKEAIRELKDQLKRFQEMAKKMRQRTDQALKQVEKRKLPRSAPEDANDTSPAREILKTGLPPLRPNPSSKDIYELIRQYENETQKNHLAVSAAKQALLNGLSFPEAYSAMQFASSQMTSFDQLVSNQTNGEQWKRSSESKASAGLHIGNTEELNNYRGLLSQAGREVGLAGARLAGLFGVPRTGGNRSASGSSSDAGGGKMGSGANSATGGGGTGGMGVNFSNTANKTAVAEYQGPRLNQEMVKAQALPGRRFSKTAVRKGWLYVNTWYIVGPWESFGKDDFSIVHPPETSIDLDAVYKDGQRGVGIAETDADPLKMIGPKVRLDGTLRWKFMQSTSMHNTVPVTTDHSTYYAYTELYFDEGTTMLVAIGTDDSGRVWINGKEVWQD